MARFKRHFFWSGLVAVLLMCLIAPFLMLYSYGETEHDNLSSVKLRKALDIGSNDDDDDDDQRLNDQYRDLKSQIDELQRIKVSVRNEMRELEKKRNSVIQDTESHKTSYYKMETALHKGHKQLNILQADLVKAGHQLYAATPPPNYGHTEPPPVYIVSGETKPLYTVDQDTSQDDHKIDRISSCNLDISECIDFSKCPLIGNLKFHVYPIQSFIPSSLKLKYPKLLDSFVSHLKDSNSLADNPDEACLFLVVLGPFNAISTSGQPIDFKNLIHNLKYWNRDGRNHVVINLVDYDNSRNILEEFDPLKSILVQNTLTSHFRPTIDITAPMVSDVFTPPAVWKELPLLLPAQRKHLLYFSGKVDNDNNIISFVLNELSRHIVEGIDIDLKCLKETSKTSPTGMGIPLCGSKIERLNSLRQSTFAIVPMDGVTGLIRLNEALKSGTIPVVIGRHPLPFHSLINWNDVAILLPESRLKEIHFIIRSLSDNHILELRRQGRFIWETYFSSLDKVLVSTVSILRSRLSYPPPPIRDVQGKLKRYGPDITLSSPTYQCNFSIYNHRYWNAPPGPTLMFPHTPWDVTLISGSMYSTMTDDELAHLPPHILQAGGITGPYFENYLLSDRPAEYFTVVMLTYKREDVVVEAVGRLDDLKFLAKVIVVWNDLEKSPYEINWPQISVPLEVIWAEKNSLNNRFLPYDSIQTEAVLSIDDDVYLRHDEIQFAFRVWRESRDRLVGFPGRFHAFDVHNRKWLYNSNYTCELSMVLTGAAFYHKYYSYLYSYWQPQAVLDLVDSKMNCEDIAMNFLISHITRKPPLKVTSRWTFHCPNCPDTLSQSDAHFNERHECVNTLTEIYGYVPLLYTQFRLDSILFKTRLPSHLEKCYQYV